MSAEDRLSEIAAKLWPGFTITCDKCASTAVVTESDRGYSAESGGWGSLDLVCTKCGNRCVIEEG